MMERGYGDESGPLARAMLTGVANVVAIVDADPDGRALAFTLYAEKFEKTLVDRAEKYAIFDADTAQKARETAERKFTDARAMFERFGVIPSYLGDSPRTWHGLNTEKDLFAKMGMSHLYDLDYAWLSDEAHLNVGAISKDVADAFEGNVGFGPKGNVPETVLMASSDSVPEALAQLSNLLGLGKRDEADRIRAAFKRELHAKEGR